MRIIQLITEPVWNCEFHMWSLRRKPNEEGPSCFVIISGWIQKAHRQTAAIIRGMASPFEKCKILHVCGRRRIGLDLERGLDRLDWVGNQLAVHNCITEFCSKQNFGHSQHTDQIELTTSEAHSQIPAVLFGYNVASVHRRGWPCAFISVCCTVFSSTALEFKLAHSLPSPTSFHFLWQHKW